MTICFFFLSHASRSHSSADNRATSTAAVPESVGYTAPARVRRAARRLSHRRPCSLARITHTRPRKSAPRRSGQNRGQNRGQNHRAYSSHFLAHNSARSTTRCE